MSSHDTRSSQHTTSRTKASSSSEPTDLKKLKSKYGSKLATLKELFADWSDDDLLFAISEADGDLELTIDRISEGHTSQWGEVKTKKSKKEAQKAKAATLPPPATQPSYNKPERSQAPRVPTDRTRPGRGAPAANRGSAPRSVKPASSHLSSAPSWGDNRGRTAATSATKPSQDAGNTWASIARTAKAQQEPPASSQDTTGWNATADDGWNAPSSFTNDTTAANDGWSAPSTAAAATTSTTTSNTAPHDSTAEPTSSESTAIPSEQPKTWASLLKAQAKPEPVQQPSATENETEQEKPSNEPPVTDEWSAAVDVNSGWNASESAWNTSEKAEETQSDVPEWATEPEPVKPVDEAAPAADAGFSDTKTKQAATRRLNQEEPVVLPNSGSSLTSVGVKFGSLTIDDSGAETLETVEQEVVSSTKPTLKEQANAIPSQQPSQPQQPAATEKSSTESQPQQTYADRYPANAAAANIGQTVPDLQSVDAFGAQNNNNASYLKQQQQQQEPTYGTQAQLGHHQQQIPQQPFGMEQLTSAYSNYLPNQTPAGISGFGMNPMATLPDYGLYGTEAQRAAAMGYYDPAAFSHSPSVTAASAYPGREKYGQDASPMGTPNVASAGAQSIPQQQQMYPANLPYFQYYYMPNQFNGYPPSGYGQHFMNKSMYPAMYQHTAKPTAGASPYNATGSPYNATGSPYASQSHLYNQTVAGGYDDMAALQQQLGGMGGGLSDYQKMYGSNPQIHGILGNLPAHGGQPAQGQVSQQSNAAGKADVGGSQYSKYDKGSGAAGGPLQGSQQGQQPLYQQSLGGNPSNYFGQSQQMFGYQQQYPQSLHQYQQQQGQPNQQAPSVSRQQQQQAQPAQQPQYWNQ
ncbi:uncharacterized protein BYT42DRAFT_564652 [Radiomyces spectabilis]|uniref:uncharacterized protein n=1 Tax=Radiomyces spectabilis TaxID=64574 RepID=UPI002220A1D9|nr:uncharacterized protein BYT42DRAFT_564652 [Radiomyces spectabilis]KAI8380908.1 hypothetical protein BYT42DRAFT_564652 [Radiomyces spectabilis]